VRGKAGETCSGSREILKSEMEARGQKVLRFEIRAHSGRPGREGKAWDVERGFLRTRRKRGKGEGKKGGGGRTHDLERAKSILN